MFNIKRFFKIFIAVVLLTGLSATVYLALQPKGAFETRKKAAERELTKSLNPTPLPTILFTGPTINFTLSLEKRNNQSISVTLYGMDPTSLTKIAKLGTATTNNVGEGQIILPSSFVGQKLYLFAETRSHLRKAAKTHMPLEIKEGNNPDEGRIDFGTFIAGDIYLDASGYKNNLIDIYDKATLLNAIKEAQKNQGNLGWADLNGDGAIDVADLAILSSNLGKTGDIFPLVKE